MNKIAILLALSGGLILTGCSASAGGGSGGNDPKPVPATTTEDQLRILTAGKVPLLNGAPNTIDVIVHNASNLPVKGARFSLPSNMRNAQITSTNGCEQMIAPNSDCRVSLQFNNIDSGLDQYKNQVLNVNYTNWKGTPKTIHGMYTAVKVMEMTDTPQLNYVSMPDIMTDKGSNHLGGVAYFYVNNPNNSPYTLNSIKFDSGAYSVVSTNVAIGSQLSNGQLIEIEYDALKSIPLKNSTSLNSVQQFENGGYSNLVLNDSLGNSLKVGAVSDYISGSYLIAGSLNPLNAAFAESDVLTITNVGFSNSNTVNVDSSPTGIVNISQLLPDSKISTSVPSTANITTIPDASNPSLTIKITTDNQAEIDLPLTVINDIKPSSLLLQPVSYTFAAESGVSPSSVGESQDIVIYNTGNESASVTTVLFTVIGNHGKVSVRSGTNPYTGCNTIPAKGNCVIRNVNITSNADEPNGIVSVTITYNNPSTPTTQVTGGGVITYNSVQRSSASLTPDATFTVVGNQNAVNYESVIVYNTGTANRSIILESMVMTHVNSAASWNYINTLGSCESGITQLPPASAESCTIGITLGPVTNPQITINSNESMTVWFVTEPLGPDTATSVTESIPFQVTPDNANIILQSYTAGTSLTGGGTSATPYLFDGSQDGATHQITLTYQNRSANDVVINNIQHYNNPFYWVLGNGDNCSHLNIKPNESCTITYTDNLYTYASRTTQSGPLLNNSLTLPGLFFTESQTSDSFAVTPTNPLESSSLMITSNEQILWIKHQPIESGTAPNMVMNMYSVPTVNTGDNVNKYSFIESTSIAANGLITQTYLATPTCSVTFGAGIYANMYSQTCTGGAGLTNSSPFGIQYNVIQGGGIFPSPISLMSTYSVMSTGKNQAISQNSNQVSANVQ